LEMEAPKPQSSSLSSLKPMERALRTKPKVALINTMENTLSNISHKI